METGGADGAMDSGYCIFAHITGKSVDELRIETAAAIKEQPTKFADIQNASTWISGRYPEEANTLLGSVDQSSTHFQNIIIEIRIPKCSIL